MQVEAGSESTAHGNETELTGIRLTDLPGTSQRISDNQ